MKKKTVFFILVVLLLSAAVHSQSQSTDPKPPKIAVTVNGKVIDYVVGLYEWDGVVYDR